MGIWEVVFIALGVSMDAAAVAMSDGICCRGVTIRQAAKIAGMFGVFQGILFETGYFAGSVFENAIASIAHWVALILLGFLGGRMMWESRTEPAGNRDGAPLSGRLLLLQAIATSIDAVAVGVNFAALPYEGGAAAAAAIICAATWIFSFLSVFLGRRFGGLLQSKAELVGGGILAGIGIKIFLEHIAR